MLVVFPERYSDDIVIFGECESGKDGSAEDGDGDIEDVE